jgi:mannose-6-phosphate isomerase-like protein (cupin superfamily)
VPARGRHAPVTPGVGAATVGAMRILRDAGGYTAPAVGQLTHFVERLRVPDLSLGTYSIPAGGTDDQRPHTEDELYIVTAGRARLETPGDSGDVEPGDVIFVPAGEEHRFTDVTEDLAVLVIFGPAYRTRG